MSLEIERRFLVLKDRLPKLRKGYLQTQGYLNKTPEDSSEIRIRIEEKTATLTIKSFINFRTRQEFEYKIPMKDAEKLLKSTKHTVTKIRHHIKIDNKIWVIDFFQGKNSPLIIAEIELDSETELFEKPLWLGREVTHDLSFTALSLAFQPFNTWKRRKLNLSTVDKRGKEKI